MDTVFAFIKHITIAALYVLNAINVNYHMSAFHSSPFASRNDCGTPDKIKGRHTVLGCGNRMIILRCTGEQKQLSDSFIMHYFTAVLSKLTLLALIKAKTEL